MSNIFAEYSYKKGAAVSIFCTAAWKILSFANGVMLAFYFGASFYTDIYFYLIMLAGMGGTFISGINTNVIIPQAMHLGARDKESEFGFLNCFILFYLAAGLLFAVCAAAAPGFWLGLTSRFNSFTVGAHALFNLAAVYFISLIITGFFINILERRKIFGIAWLSPLNALIPFLLLVFFHKTLGVAAMLSGFILANAAQSAACLTVMFVKLDWTLTLDTRGLTKKFWHNLAAAAGTEGLNFFTAALPVFIMSGLGGAAVSALNYAKQIIDSPTEIITNRIASVSRVQFNEKENKQDYAGLAESFYNNLLILLILITPIAVFCCFFSRDIVRLFFERGNFSDATTKNTAVFVSLFTPTLVLLLPSYLYRNLAAAGRKLKEFFIFPLISALFFTAAVFYLMNIYGGFGYPAALVFTNIFGLMIISFFVKKHLAFISHAKTIFEMIKILCLALAPMLIIILCTKTLFQNYIVNLIANGIF
ncbi:MAG: hypothetical protein LBI01_00115, partial [Elusimicrobium sp.]|nr:hypothetical protein [Elusimicrobium sp.]